MEGKLVSTNGLLDLEAGIIPRTLDRLFYQVEVSETQLFVRATFVELYNEDLRDLLAAEPPPGTSAHAPPASARAGGLRIYESKEGAQIQGLQETPIHSAEEGLALLRRGSNKRQVASTKCNDSSSRSHSIFTLTVYSRDASSAAPGSKDEEGTFRVGKLHLVDLAGSESIDRSKAEGKGAREAGMINKSLLTLGRVINALVEGSSHVPYRESNLTRLLQDSLGGGTKTSIVATVSQAKSNVDETLSTLDYALRAKSIKNRPELHSKASSGVLLRELEAKYKAVLSDNQALIAQSGRFTSEENWDKMQAEHECARKERDEWKRDSESKNGRLATLTQQNEQLVRIDAKRQAKYDELVSAFESTVAASERRQMELDAMRRHNAVLEQSERALHAVATELQDDGLKSSIDIDGLLAKIGESTHFRVTAYSQILTRVPPSAQAVNRKTKARSPRASPTSKAHCSSSSRSSSRTATRCRRPRRTLLSGCSKPRGATRNPPNSSASRPGKGSRRAAQSCSSVSPAGRSSESRRAA